MLDFGFRDADVPKKLQGLMVDPWLWRGRAPRVTVIVDRMLREREKENLLRLLKQTGPLDYFEVLYGLKLEPETLKSGIHWFIGFHRINLEKYLTIGRPVVTFGNALTVITRDGDVTYEAFLDKAWNKTYLDFHPMKLRVYPCFPLSDLIDVNGKVLDAFPNFHFLEQVNQAFTTKYENRRLPQCKTVVVENPNEFLEAHMGPGEVAWDLETGGFDFVDDKIGCLTLSFDGVTGYYLRWKDIDIPTFNRFLEGKFQLGANLKFDVKFVRRLGVSNARIDFDSMQCGHMLNEIRSNSLKTHAWIYTNIGGYDWDLENWKRNNPRVKSYLDIPEDVISKYAALDAVATFQTWKAMRKHLAKDPLLEKYFDTYIMPALNMFCDIEYEGVVIDWEALDQLKAMLEPKIEEIRQRCFDALGVDWIDLDSGKVMGLHYEKMGFTDLGRAKEKVNGEGETTSGGYYLSGKDIVGEWIKQGHTELMPILEYSKWTALRDTFCGNLTTASAEGVEDVLIDPSKWVAFGDEDAPKKKKNKSPGYRKYRSSDNMLHSNFLVFYAASHRHRSSNPNLQNIAKKDEEIAKLIRNIFRTPNDEEYYIAEGDSAGLQLRIGAAQSNDANMRRAFLEVPGGDLHSVTGHFVFTPHISLEEFLKEKKSKYKKYRNRSKSINFGLIFGASAKVLVEQTLLVEWTDKDAEEFVAEKQLDWRVETLIAKGKSRRMANFTACAEFIREKFFELYPGLIDWHEENQAFAEANGYIRSPFGARRLLPWLTYTGADSDGAETKNMKNIAVNSPVQNHEVIPMSTVMLKLHHLIKERKLKSRIALTVHDSVVVYVARSEIQLIAKTMLDAFAFDFAENNGIGTMGEINFAKMFKGPNGEPSEVWGFGKVEIDNDNVGRICEVLGETTLQVA